MFISWFPVMTADLKGYTGQPIQVLVLQPGQLPLILWTGHVMAVAVADKAGMILPLQQVRRMPRRSMQVELMCGNPPTEGLHGQSIRTGTEDVVCLQSMQIAIF